MSADITLHIISIVAIFAMLYANKLAYKHGIWDGAFNQFLPHVQSAMREYDKKLADEMLKNSKVAGPIE